MLNDPDAPYWVTVLDWRVSELEATRLTSVAAHAADAATQASIAALQAAITTLQARQTRTAITALPAVAIGATTDITMSWTGQGAMPSTDYTVAIAVEGGTSLLGVLSYVLKTGSRTTTGCTVTVKNSGLAAISNGAGNVNVVAYT